MNGQRFRFLGYLPQDLEALGHRLGQVERDAQRDETQIFIETPYRTERLFQAILSRFAGSTRLCLAVDLGAPSQTIVSMTIERWRALAEPQRPTLKRRPAVFLVHARPAPRGMRQ